MEKTIKFLPVEKIVQATVSGTISAKDYETLLVELRLEAAQHAASRLLVDLHNPVSAMNLLGIHEVHDFNKDIALKPARRAAIVYGQMSEQATGYLNYFCYRINMEGFEVGLFADDQATLNWLAEIDA